MCCGGRRGGRRHQRRPPDAENVRVGALPPGPCASSRCSRCARGGGGAGRGEGGGRVRRRDGSAVPGVLVAMIEHSMQATALEPTFVPTDSHGAWRISLPAGGYTLAVSAAGYRAQTRALTCGGEHT